MVRSRVYGILAGNADQNDHDTLRADPVVKLVADRSPEEDDLASQATRSRFENVISDIGIGERARVTRAKTALQEAARKAAQEQLQY